MSILNLLIIFLISSPSKNGFLLFVLGIVFLLTIYHFLLYFQHKSRTYLYYACYTFLIFTAYFTYTQNDFLDQITKPTAGFFSLTHEFWVWLYNIAYYLFAFQFLKFKKHHTKQTRYIKYILLFLFIVGFALFFTTLMKYDKSLLISGYLYLYMPVIIPLTLYSFYLVYQTPEKTRNYILAGSFTLFLSSILTILIIEYGFFTSEDEVGFLIFYIGIIIENIFFSLGLGMRQKEIIAERNETKDKLILKLQENETLKNQVNKELEEKITVLKNQIALKEELENLKIKAFKSQMNPHFIFNAINSIKQFIIKNNSKEAAYYLTKFSKLIRIILEATEQKSISVEEELETMKLYLKIENMRFDNEINFEFIADEHLDLDNLKIPPLLLQPFLENAIWHGLSTKEGGKKIKVVVSTLNENFFKILIIDNGIGRIAAEQKNIKTKHHKKSFGTNLIKERLEDFTRNYRNKSEILFEDLLDKNNQPQGTKVELKIPLS